MTVHEEVRCSRGTGMEPVGRAVTVGPIYNDRPIEVIKRIGINNIRACGNNGKQTEEDGDYGFFHKQQLITYLTWGRFRSLTRKQLAALKLFSTRGFDSINYRKFLSRKQDFNDEVVHILLMWPALTLPRLS